MIGRMAFVPTLQRPVALRGATVNARATLASATKKATITTTI